MIKLCDINQTAREKLPPGFRDKSNIGVHYVDAFITPMNTTLADAAAAYRIADEGQAGKVVITM